MKIGAELNSENSPAAGETGQVQESPLATPLGAEAATPVAAADSASGEGSLATGARDLGSANAVIFVEPSVAAEKFSSAREIGGDSRVGDSSIAIASSGAAAVDPLGDALAALDRKDYATAQGLFEALGRKDAAAAIEDALAALDRKDYATAQGLFEALGKRGAAATPVKGPARASSAAVKPAASAAGPIASDSRGKAQQEQVISSPAIIPFVDAEYRRPPPQAKKAKARGFKSLLLRTGLVLLAIFAAFDIYISPINWTFANTKNEAIAGVASAVDDLKASLETITGASEREKERSAMRDLSAALTQVTIRLDEIEREYGARLDKLGERVDQDPSSRFAEITAKLDKLEKKAGESAAPASGFTDVVSRIDKLEKRVAAAAAPASEFADITTRLNKLEKRAAVAAASSAKPLPPAAPKQSPLTARAEPSASNETGGPDNPRGLLRDYSVENVQDGIAVVDSRYGSQQVAPGDVIPGAGRVLRIERRGGDWIVLTSRGVIASGPAPE